MNRTAAAGASYRSWQRLESALWAEGHRPGRDRTISYAAAHGRAMEQMRRAALRVAR